MTKAPQVFKGKRKREVENQESEAIESYRPIGDRLLVELDGEESEYWLPENKRSITGVVLSKGRDVKEILVGSHVSFVKLKGNDIWIGDREYCVVAEGQVILWW